MDGFLRIADAVYMFLTGPFARVVALASLAFIGYRFWFASDHSHGQEGSKLIKWAFGTAIVFGPGAILSLFI